MGQIPNQAMKGSGYEGTGREAWEVQQGVLNLGAPLTCTNDGIDLDPAMYLYEGPLLVSIRWYLGCLKG